LVYKYIVVYLLGLGKKKVLLFSFYFLYLSCW